LTWVLGRDIVWPDNVKGGPMKADRRQKVFQREMAARLLAAGAVEGEQAFGYRYRLETRAGTLVLTMHASDLDGKSRILSLFGRFLNPVRAVGYTGESNPYSGKWNFHFGEDCDPLEAVEQVMFKIEGVLPERGA